MDKYSLKLILPFEYNGETVTEARLSRINGLREEIMSKKGQRPYSWIARILSVAVDTLGSKSVSPAVLEDYIKTKNVEIPDIVKKMSIAESSTFMVEIHRRLWQAEFKEQRITCAQCTKEFSATVNLNKLEMKPEDKVYLESVGGQVIKELKANFANPVPLQFSDKSSFAKYNGLFIKSITYRVPELRDAINNETILVEDSRLAFWRGVAKDTQTSAELCNESGEVIDTLDKEVLYAIGSDLYEKLLDRVDVKEVRETLENTLPSLPWLYEDICGCMLEKKVPYVIEAEAFFGA
jgi:hypothetical protein